MTEPTEEPTPTTEAEPSEPATEASEQASQIKTQPLGVRIALWAGIAVLATAILLVTTLLVLAYTLEPDPADYGRRPTAFEKTVAGAISWLGVHSRWVKSIESRQEIYDSIEQLQNRMRQGPPGARPPAPVPQRPAPLGPEPPPGIEPIAPPNP